MNNITVKLLKLLGSGNHDESMCDMYIEEDNGEVIPTCICRDCAMQLIDQLTKLTILTNSPLL